MGSGPSSSAASEPVLAQVCAGCDASVDAAASACRACGAARPRGGWPLDAHVGRTIAGRYRLLERIGKGGMGSVYRAHDCDCSSAGDLGFVVVKLLSVHGASERRRFSNEARAARRLSSPHAVKIYDFGFDAEHPYLVMELLRGKTLREVLCERGALDPAFVRELGVQICQALGEAHEAEIVHRDLKPDNLMLVGTELRFVKVLDFGAARLLGVETTGSAIGTPWYMAPEQFSDGRIDARADLYAFGACLFEMLTGRPPYDGSTVLAVMNAHLRAPVPCVSTTAPDVPIDLVLLCERLLAKDPNDRPQTAAEVEDALAGRAPRSVVVGPRPSAAPDLALARTASIGRVSRRGIASRAAIAVGAVAVVSALVAVSLRGSSESPVSGAALPDPATNSAPDKAPSSAPPAPTADAVPVPEPVACASAPTPRPASRPAPSTAATAEPAKSSQPRSGHLREEDF
jgi:eukaryotic-like serine/threonine-protein kinase